MPPHYAFRRVGGVWLPGSRHTCSTGPGGAHREVGGRSRRGYSAGEILDGEGVPVYRTGVGGHGSGSDGLGDSAVPERLRRAIGCPIWIYVPWRYREPWEAASWWTG